MDSDIFNQREKAFENKFKMDEEQRFKMHARAAKLFGLWIAERLGLSGREAEKYAEKMIELEVQEPDITDIVKRAQKDLAAKGIEMNERLLYNQFSAKLDQARRRQVS